jgi:hypothetical protein
MMFMRNMSSFIFVAKWSTAKSLNKFPYWKSSNPLGKPLQLILFLILSCMVISILSDIQLRHVGTKHSNVSPRSIRNLIHFYYTVNISFGLFTEVINEISSYIINNIYLFVDYLFLFYKACLVRIYWFDVFVEYSQCDTVSHSGYCYF